VLNIKKITMANYFIFRCSNSTYQECLDRMLFGQKNSSSDFVKNVKIGDILFLHNLTEQFIEGPFFAISNGSNNIEPDAWNGNFPWQVKVEKKGKTSQIDKNLFENFGLKFVFQKKFFDFQIPTHIGRKLVEEMGLEIDHIDKKIKDYDTLDSIDIDYRLKYEAKFRCIDGHYVRSKNEVIVDNWLFDHNITHGYEKKLPGQNLLCDFYIKRKTGEEIYIEVWGLDDPEYNKRKADKIKIYKKEGLRLINIDERNIQNIDDYLGDQLKQML
jgi:hypothetical protein